MAELIQVVVGSDVEIPDSAAIGCQLRASVDFGGLLEAIAVARGLHVADVTKEGTPCPRQIWVLQPMWGDYFYICQECCERMLAEYGPLLRLVTEEELRERIKRLCKRLCLSHPLGGYYVGTVKKPRRGDVAVPCSGCGGKAWMDIVKRNVALHMIPFAHGQFLGTVLCLNCAKKEYVVITEMKERPYQYRDLEFQIEELENPTARPPEADVTSGAAHSFPCLHCGRIYWHRRRKNSSGASVEEDIPCPECGKTHQEAWRELVWRRK